MEKKVKEFAIDLALEAGGIIRKNFGLEMNREWKGDNTPVTSADKNINDLVLKKIQRSFPTHSILSEEESHIIKNSEYTWVCDPIDGTFPFSHGIPISVFALALTKNGVSILGVMYDPFLDRLFFAEKGKGAYLNNKKIAVSSSKNLKNTMVECINWVGAKYEIFPLYRTLSELRCHTSHLLSFCYGTTLVACGEYVAAIYPDKKPWDAAAAKIIVEEAGGKVTDMFGNEQKYDQQLNGVIVSNGFVHKQLLELVRKSIS